MERINEMCSVGKKEREEEKKRREGDGETQRGEFLSDIHRTVGKPFCLASSALLRQGGSKRGK